MLPGHKRSEGVAMTRTWGWNSARRYGALTLACPYRNVRYSHVPAEEGRHRFELLHKPYEAKVLFQVLRRVIRH
jgi:hypothetical protein